jgi:cell wall assembly regulator SMI1
MALECHKPNKVNYNNSGLALRPLIEGPYMPTSKIVAAWETIEAELQAQFPAVSETLAPPAQASEIDQIEEVCNVVLPQDFRDSLLRHNGQRGSYWRCSLVNGADLLGAGDIIKYWQMWALVVADSNETDPPENTSDEIATDVIWHPKWIPFAVTGNNMSYVIDLAPRSKGSVGQVFTHASGSPGEILARSFTEWLEGLASKLARRSLQ